MRKILGLVRLMLFAVIGFTAALVFFVLGVVSRGHKGIFTVFNWGKAAIRFALNIHVRMHGDIPRAQGVIMSNHRSYIDVILIPSAIPYVIVAKKQVKPWPIVGQAAMGLKTIFVDRDSAESRKKTREAIKQRLKQGLSVLIYPEGTTFEGPGVLDFKPGMFRHCAEDGFAVVPIAIEFKIKEMCWIGDDTFLRHFIEAFGHWRIDVDVSVGPVMMGIDGETLRRECQAWVDAETRRLASLQLGNR